MNPGPFLLGYARLRLAARASSALASSLGAALARPRGFELGAREEGSPLARLARRDSWPRYRLRMRLLPGAVHFQVTELPAYAAEGAGEHLYVLVEKEGVNTDEVADALARALRRPARDVGWAGRKDRVAIARQWFSVRLGEETGLAKLE